MPDAATGTRWFADKDLWVQDGDRLLPFTTEDGAQAYRSAHPGARPLSWQEALAAA